MACRGLRYIATSFHSIFLYLHGVEAEVTNYICLASYASLTYLNKKLVALKTANVSRYYLYQLEEEMGKCKCKNTFDNIKCNMIQIEPGGSTTARL